MDFELQDLADKTIKYSLEKGLQYCDVRAEVQNMKSVLIENGEIENIRETAQRGIGVRFLKNGIWRFFSVTNPIDFQEIRKKLDKSIKNSQYLSSQKFELSEIPIVKIKKNFPVRKKPEIEDLIDIGLGCDKIISDKTRIIKSSVNPWEVSTSKYFTSSEGAKILQNYTDVIVEMIATAHEAGITQSLNITEGGRGGLEILTDYEIVEKSANEISKKACQLTTAKHLNEEVATVVMNPDFVALLTHEILGHPSEADRVLGKEMAWAGGAWWEKELGNQIGSENLNVFDDPTIKHSLGWYDFDDEGVKAQRTTLVKEGILTEHMQNRETSNTFGTKPTGNMRATNYKFMPLIRMSCTCIKEGDWQKEEMIKEVKKGYLISNMKIPSIDMMRYNWSISCQYAQKIENGEITDLLRDVIVIGTAPEFFKSIDACGKDFTIRPITNCGKGDPMQSMIMGNGGPSIRGIATVKSVN